MWDEKTTVGLLPAPKHRKKAKQPMKKEGNKWQEKRAEKEWGGVFQYPSEGGVSRGVISNVK